MPDIKPKKLTGETEGAQKFEKKQKDDLLKEISERLNKYDVRLNELESRIKRLEEKCR